jgi:hypothetical protein
MDGAEQRVQDFRVGAARSQGVLERQQRLVGGLEDVFRLCQKIFYG